MVNLQNRWVNYSLSACSELEEMDFSGCRPLDYYIDVSEKEQVLDL